MRRAAKVDDNHKDIVKALRQLGCTVADTSAVGKGFPDIVVGYRGQNYLVEIKDGAKCKSAQKLTDHQEKFFAEWRGNALVVNSIDSAIKALTIKIDEN